MFLRQLCGLPLDYTAKEIFLYRLVNFNGRISSQRGFIPDIHRSLGKYSLTHVLHTFAEIGTFISKTFWKRLVGDKIREIYETERACRVQSSVSVGRIVNINDANKELCGMLVNIPAIFTLSPNSCPYACKNIFGRMASYLVPLW